MPWYRPTQSTHSYFTPKLSLPLLAAYTDKIWDIEIEESIDASTIRDCSERTDLIGISVLTTHAYAAYDLADHFRMQGVPVILGGPHVSLMPREALQHADSIVIGEADDIWTTVLSDFQQDKLKALYIADKIVDTNYIGIPRRDLLKPENFSNFNTFIASRGCKRSCVGCTVPDRFGRTARLRPIEHIDREIDTIEGLCKFQPLIFMDPILSNEAYSRRLGATISQKSMSWSAEGQIEDFLQESYVEFLARNGLVSVYIEADPALWKGIDSPERLMAKRCIRNMREHNIEIALNVTYGYESDELEVFDRSLDFIFENDIQYPLLEILVPWPGSKHYYFLERDARIVDKNWSHYDNQHVVFAPRRMSIDQLMYGYKKASQHIEQYYIDNRVTLANTKLKYIYPSDA